MQELYSKNLPFNLNAARFALLCLSQVLTHGSARPHQGRWFPARSTAWTSRFTISCQSKKLLRRLPAFQIYGPAMTCAQAAAPSQQSPRATLRQPDQRIRVRRDYMYTLAMKLQNVKPRIGGELGACC